jgi:hypothetical protein
MRASSTMRLPC